MSFNGTELQKKNMSILLKIDYFIQFLYVALYIFLYFVSIA